MDALARLVLVADRWMCRLLDIFMITVAGILLVLLNYAVFARFVLNSSVSWGKNCLPIFWPC